MCFYHHKLKIALIAFLIINLCNACVHDSIDNKQHHYKTWITDSKQAILELKKGNDRFLHDKSIHHHYLEEIEQTKEGQHPHSIVLSCMDSRVPPEIIFDQGIGNIFTVRVAGNIEDSNVLASIEYAIKYAHTPLIVVMAHNHCGAVKGALKNINVSHLTQLAEQIKPSIPKNKNSNTNNHGIPREHVEFDEISDETAKKNIHQTIIDILHKSELIKSYYAKKDIDIIGAFYNIESGKVEFYTSYLDLNINQ